MKLRSLRLPHQLRDGFDFWIVAGLIVAAFLFGGGARDDIVSLAVLRPMAAIAFVYAVAGLTREQFARYRQPLLFMAAVITLILLHLVPLPPAIWSGLPGRQVLVEAAAVAGIEQPWRPLAMVPWRAWNALYAMMLPAAALLLALRCNAEERAKLVAVVLACGMTSVLLGALQAVGGYRPSLYLYSVSSVGYPVGLFANRNHQAVMICALLPLLAAVVGRSSPHRRTLLAWLAAAAGATMLIVLLISGSRAGIALSLVALGAVAIVHPARLGRSRARMLLLIILPAVAAALLALLVATFLEIGGIERLLAFDAKDERRFQTWPAIVQMIPHFFPLGAGMGSFVDAYMMLEPRELLRSTYLNHAHSDPLEWAFDAGLPAIGLIVWAIVGWVGNTLSLLVRRRRRGTADPLPLAGSAVILILGLASVVDYPLRVPSLMLVFTLATVWMVDRGRARDPVRESRAGEATSSPKVA